MLYEGNEDKSKSPCAFTLETVFDTLVRRNISTPNDLKTKRIVKNTDITNLLTFVQTVSRGKCTILGLSRDDILK